MTDCDSWVSFPLHPTCGILAVRNANHELPGRSLLLSKRARRSAQGGSIVETRNRNLETSSSPRCNHGGSIELLKSKQTRRSVFQSEANVEPRVRILVFAHKHACTPTLAVETDV